ncbi:hypothetical protein ACBR40_05695 [Nonomuraea sp. AD125B]|uniref:hypothetical protein n=1 Tax=Nonomuraea sp. AD125B TaxID=3242897 RepID=UPI0035272FFE
MRGRRAARAATRSYQHSGRLGYHSDPSDAVALLCVRPARSGGRPDSFYAKPLCTPRPGGGVSIAYGPDYLRSALRGACVPPFTPRLWLTT